MRSRKTRKYAVRSGSTAPKGCCPRGEIKRGRRKSDLAATIGTSKTEYAIGNSVRTVWTVNNGYRTVRRWLFDRCRRDSWPYPIKHYLSIRHSNTTVDNLVTGGDGIRRVFGDQTVYTLRVRLAVNAPENRGVFFRESFDENERNETRPIAIRSYWFAASIRDFMIEFDVRGGRNSRLKQSTGLSPGHLFLRHGSAVIHGDEPRR